jgi:hypothetical protein
MIRLASRVGCGCSTFTAALLATVLAPAAVRLEPPAPRVGQFEKLEMVIHLDRQYRNPFDPAEVRVDVELAGPAGQRLVLPAFFTQDYERGNAPRGGKTIAWFYPSGPPLWKARFAPPQQGQWHARAVVVDATGRQESKSVSFQCDATAHKGYLRVSDVDPSYLRFSTGEPFLAVGQNLAFVGEGQYVDVRKAEEIFRKLSENGANYLRVWTCCQDWALALEARKSAWGRSWGGGATLVADDGDASAQRQLVERQFVELRGEKGKVLTASPSHPVAVRPETKYVLTARVKSDGKARLRAEIAESRSEAVGNADATWAPLHSEFTTTKNQHWIDHVRLALDVGGKVLIDSLSLKEDFAGAPELLWEADPNRLLPGSYNLLDAAMLDALVTEAERQGVYLQLCVVTRDLYMKQLRNAESPEYEKSITDVKNLMRYCVARWGYSTGVAAWEYFNEIDPGLPTDRFYTDVGAYLAEVDIYRHPRTTSTWHHSKKDLRHASLDIGQVHHYLRPTLGEAGQDEVAAVVQLAAYLREHGPGKPGMIAEFGLADDKWGLSPLMKQDEGLEHFRHALWSSALSGAAGTAMFWWWEQIDIQDGYRHYKPLAKFLADEPFGQKVFSPLAAQSSLGHVRVVGLTAGDRMLLWLFNSEATWHKRLVEKHAAQEIAEMQITVPNVADGNWRVEWWDTRSGEIVRREAVSADGSLQLAAPPMTSDMAVKLIRTKQD